MGAPDYRLLAEATVLLLLVRLGVWILPFATLRRLIDRLRLPKRRSKSDGVARLAWAVAVVARRLPSTTCLVQALAAEVMLRHRGYTPALRLGVRGRADDVKLIEAHAWLECGGTVVVGQVENLADYSMLSPPRRS